MKFGPVSIDKAEGAVLAHALMVGGQRLKKGHVLDAADCGAIADAGVSEVIVAQLDADDVPENEAAALIAAVLANGSIKPANAFTGRANLHASGSGGLFLADAGAIDAANRIDPAITVATLADETWVDDGRMVATVKIIPLAVARKSVDAVMAELAKKEVLEVKTSTVHRVGLIATQLPSLKTSVMDKTRKVLDGRLKPSGSKVVEELRVPHETNAVSDALVGLAKKTDMIIVFGASAITDHQDVIPGSVERAGGVVYRFGMPVDPGNLLLTGRLNGVPVIGAPGCARSLVENGFDWVLQRLLCGMPVDDDYLSGLGVGGLLMEIHDRPQPREGDA